MSTANVLVMIDHLVTRYGLSDAAGRAQCLKWVQLAEEEVWGADGWWFKQGLEDVAMSAGTREYVLNISNNRVHSLEQGGGGDMTRLHKDDFRVLVGDDATSGTPQLWCSLEASSGGLLQVEVWPVPVGGETVRAVYDRGIRTLLDTTGSVSQVPTDWRHLVLLRSEVYAAFHMGQPEAAQGFLAEYGVQLEALRALNARNSELRI